MSHGFASRPVQGQLALQRRTSSSFPPHFRHRVGHAKMAALPPTASAITADRRYASLAGAAPLASPPPPPPPPPPDVSQMVAADLKQAQQYFSEARLAARLMTLVPRWSCRAVRCLPVMIFEGVVAASVARLPPRCEQQSPSRKATGYRGGLMETWHPLSCAVLSSILLQPPCGPSTLFTRAGPIGTCFHPCTGPDSFCGASDPACLGKTCVSPVLAQKYPNNSSPTGSTTQRFIIMSVYNQSGRLGVFATPVRLPSPSPSRGPSDLIGS